MKRRLLFIIALAWTLVHAPVKAKDGQVSVRVDGTNTLLQVQGAQEDEWRFQMSSDLVTWSNAPALGTVFSGDASAKAVSGGNSGTAQCFYRAVKAAGLYDPLVIRTISLTFTQSNWQTKLKANYASGSNLLANLEVDGISYPGVGVHYRGNTSYTMGGVKKSLAIDVDFTNATQNLMGYASLNLNNAKGDNTIMREPLYFNIMRAYTICPRASFAKVYINGVYWGLYSFVEQENSDLIKEYCPSTDGDRWRAPNMAGTTGGGGGPGGGGGGFSSGTSALTYLGTNVATYKANYALKTDKSTNAWERLVQATYVLNNTATNLLRDKIEDVLAVDRWLWFLALEDVFADEDSYYYKGADYCFYYEPESGRYHPVEHDGNETFLANDVQLSPVQGTGNANRPVISRLLAIPELRQRYLAHLRTVLQEFYNPTVMTSLIDQFSSLSAADIAADTKKSFTMAGYNTAINTLKSFIQKRYTYLTNHTELRPLPPIIDVVSTPSPAPGPDEAAIITAAVHPDGANGIDSVWLYHRDKPYGWFASIQMFDDGTHGDGLAGDGVFGAATTNYPAGAKIHYYVEARSANSAKAAAFAPARAEQETYSYRVALVLALNTPVVINELMAANKTTVADPQGEYDDWIELRNLTDQEVDLTGRYLTDEPINPRKWAFPDDTKIAARGYLLVWADENGSATPGLHANFKLATSGEQLFLIDTDANLNAVLDSVTFEAQKDDLSYGRPAANPVTFEIMQPTPGQPNN